MYEQDLQLGLLREKSASLRVRPDRPSLAYWALSLAGIEGLLRLHVENLRPLPREDAWAYQAWLTPAEGDSVALPAFNTSADGSAFCTFSLDLRTVALGGGARLVVTAEPRTPGEQPGTEVLEGPWAELAPPPSAQSDAARHPFLRLDEPATPVAARGEETVLQTQELLTPANPLAAAGRGMAIFDFSHNTLVVSLQDAPGPDVFGQDPVTGRSFNVYAGWLSRGRGAELAPLGFFRRVYPGTYRLQARGAAPLANFDTLIISAEDRAGAFDPLSRKAYVTPYSAGGAAGGALGV